MLFGVVINIVLFVLSADALTRACIANRRTTLRHTLVWAWGAWFGWAATYASSVWLTAQAADVFRYLAICLSACAGVAVLGARRPGVGAWNFVVAGLLAVMLLPLAEGLAVGGSLHLEGPRLLFLFSTLAVMVLNYLPTCLGAASMCLGIGGLLQLLTLVGPAALSEQLRDLDTWQMILVPAAVLLGHYAVRFRRPPHSECDAIWLDFRDRFGLLWGQRMREQFNRAAANAGWPVYLRWQGLRLARGAPLPAPELQDEIVRALRALLQRFQYESR